jgi:hypothetical protein
VVSGIIRTITEDEMSDLKTRLQNAGRKAEEQKAEKQARTVKGAHLHDQIRALIKESGLEVVENTGFHKVVGRGNKLKLLVAVKGGRVDLSGFTIDSPAVTQVSEDEAKAKHLGKVRGFVNFEATDNEVMDVIRESLRMLSTPDPVVEKKPVERKTKKGEQTVEVRPEA